jgi:hypothetical protein
VVAGELCAEGEPGGEERRWAVYGCGEGWLEGEALFGAVQGCRGDVGGVDCRLTCAFMGGGSIGLCKGVASFKLLLDEVRAEDKVQERVGNTTGGNLEEMTRITGRTCL